ncbi:MAG: Asp-tRNA(Asn)/Glu-tRNA(Gln) amidotransferase subunit GatC [Nitrospirota bacterium]|jgi:aspartyl-tRNA(Asn)/glutamyl-tRNA(Gln) amidotransferase subunit C
MPITRDDVMYIARLSRLAITEEEAAMFEGQLGDILAYMEKLGELDTEDVEPTSHVLELGNVFREDKPRPSLPVDEVLANAPDRAKNFYRVPRIIE